METKRSILIVGGGTAGWMTAAYLARVFELRAPGQVAITLIESPDIGVIGVGEGAFPTIRNTLKFLKIDEAQFMRETSATFKQGIRFTDWVTTPKDDRHDHFFHPFEAPYYAEGADLVACWLAQDEATRLPFAQAMTFQKRVAEARRAPKRAYEGDFSGPLNYAYHFDALRLAQVLSRRARGLGVRHIEAQISGVIRDEAGAISHVVTESGERYTADLYVDCSGFRAELIGAAPGAAFQSAGPWLFTDRAVTCKVPYDSLDAPLESYTVATAHEAGWTWDIGLDGARGIGYVYSSSHTNDERAEAMLRRYVGQRPYDFTTRKLKFNAGYRRAQWVKNCVAVGLSAGFLEPLEATGLVLIEVAMNMIGDLLPLHGPVDVSASRFNELMGARFDNIITFLKLHYALSRREEPFWRDNADPNTWPDRLKSLLEQWKYRPPGRFDFLLDLESFAFFNYQYILYGMGFKTRVSGQPALDAEAAERIFARIRNFGERATLDLPAHRALIRQIYDRGFTEA